MLLEGTSNYFWGILLIFFIVFLTVKVCLYFIFKSCKISGWKAFIPFYNRLLLVDVLELKSSIFYKTLIPFANLYYYNIIIGKLLSAYNLESKNSIWYILIPMYKFPELVFSKPKFMLHMYDATEEFLTNQEMMYQPQPEEVKEPVVELSPEPEPEKTIINPVSYNADAVNLNRADDSVFVNDSLQPDERHETVVEAKKEEVKEETPIITVVDDKPKVCPNCKTKLASTATTCFFCGAKLG